MNTFKMCANQYTKNHFIITTSLTLFFYCEKCERECKQNFIISMKRRISYKIKCTSLTINILYSHNPITSSLSIFPSIVVILKLFWHWIAFQVMPTKFVLLWSENIIFTFSMVWSFYLLHDFAVNALEAIRKMWMAVGANKYLSRVGALGSINNWFLRQTTVLRFVSTPIEKVVNSLWEFSFLIDSHTLWIRNRL